jgi:hypothetical protein
MDGRLFDIQADPEEKSPIATEAAAHAAARKRLQATLDGWAKKAPPKFNQFESDGRKAY